jgi:hypothetical protein
MPPSTFASVFWPIPVESGLDSKTNNVVGLYNLLERYGAMLQLKPGFCP